MPESTQNQVTAAALLKYDQKINVHYLCVILINWTYYTFSPTE